MVEIAKALAFDAAIVIMDEPTSALSDSEVARLFRVIADLRKAGTTVLYISHKMNEVFTLADRVTVLRDGQFVATRGRERDLARSGRPLDGGPGDRRARLRAAPDRRRRAARGRKPVAAEPTAGAAGPACSDITFSVRAGEVLGVAGLLGAGRTELLEAIFGASPFPPSGTIRLEGRPGAVHPSRPGDQGRHRHGDRGPQDPGALFDRMTVAENITLRRLPELTFGPLVDPLAENRAVAWSIKELAIKTAGGDVPVTSLSGGNQQKCILARWLLIEPKVLLLDEPTRGIDVGAKAEIYQLDPPAGRRRAGPSS